MGVFNVGFYVRRGLAGALLVPFAVTSAIAAPRITTIYTAPADNVDGTLLTAGVVSDAQGRLYGTATQGGAHQYGTVYRLTPPPAGQTLWTEETLHSFLKQEGTFPKAPVLLGADGTIYGTTYQGGSDNFGTVFKIANVPGYPLTVLHNFDGTHGGNPLTGLTFGSDGLLYGTTFSAGTAFSLSPAGDSVEFQSVAPFGTVIAGGGPSSLTRILPGRSAPISNFIGTTNSSGNFGTGLDTVFLLKTNNGGLGSASVAYTFGLVPGDLATPIGAPIQGGFVLHGLFFGCAIAGGANSHGGVYQLTPNGTGGFSEKVIFSFGQPSLTDPAHACSVVQGNEAGTLYGLTDGLGDGQMFMLTPPTTQSGTWTEADLRVGFPNMYNPEGALAIRGNHLFVTFQEPSGAVSEISYSAYHGN